MLQTAARQGGGPTHPEAKRTSNTIKPGQTPVGKEEGGPGGDLVHDLVDDDVDVVDRGHEQTLGKPKTRMELWVSQHLKRREKKRKKQCRWRTSEPNKREIWGEKGTPRLPNKGQNLKGQQNRHQIPPTNGHSPKQNTRNQTRNSCTDTII